MVMGLIGVSAAAVPRVIEFMNKRNQSVKVLNVMAAVEQSIRNQLADLTLYSGCPAACALNPPSSSPLKIDTTQRAILGADCPITKPGCGVRLDKLEIVGDLVRVTVAYEGKEVVIRPNDFAMKVPGHASAIVECAASAPIFLGLNDAGQARCAPIQTCTSGQFVKSYDPNTLKVTCESISDGLESCSGNTFISGATFGPNLKPTLRCSQRRSE